MQRKFITNLSLLLLLNFLIKPFWIFGIDREVQNTVSALDYGTYFALFNFSMLFNIILDLGITNFNNKNIAQHHQLLPKYFSGIVVFKFLLAVLYFIITFTLGLIIGYDNYRFYILLFLTINQFLISFTQYLRSNIAGLQLFTLDSVLSVLDKSLMIIFCSILLWGNLFHNNFTLMHFIYAQTAAYLITCAIIFFITLSKAKKLSFSLNIPFLKVIIKQTFPYALLVLTMTFYYRMDAVMLDIMLTDGEKQAAIYSQAYRLMDASNQVGVLFASLLLPMFAYMIKKHQKVNDLLQLSFSLLFLPASILAIFCYNFPVDICQTLYPKDFNDASQVLPILMFCFVSISTTYIYGTLLTANGSLKTLNRLAILGLIINLTLNIILIPSFKAYGSAIASLITQTIIVSAQMLIVKKIFNIQLDFIFLVRLIVFLITSFIVIKGLKYYFDNLLFQLTLTILISLTLGITLKLIRIKNILTVLQTKEYNS